jgi:glycosyltransferase involved in cell wall biosynthesis
MGVHNEEEYLETAIESILHQTYDSLEFIITDDASTDRSQDIIESYGDQRIKIINNEINRGLTYSLNRALDHATGTYVARQDADDVSESERLERQVAFLEWYDDVALVGSGATLIDGKGDRIAQRIGYCNPTYEDFLEKNRLIHGSILARRSVLDALGGYDEFFQYSQDYDLWLRLLKKYKVANIADPLYRLRIHDESVYFSRKDESILYSTFARHLATGEVKPELKNELQGRGIQDYWDHLTDKQQAAVHLNLAKRYLRYGHQRAAVQEFKKAIEANGLSTRIIVLNGLARSNQFLIRAIHWSLRKYLNVQTRLHNWLWCPYEYDTSLE